MDAIPSYITSRRPTEADADCDGDVRLAHEDSYTIVKWQFVADGAPWAHTARYDDRFYPKEILSGWINDRLPTIDDSDGDEDVQTPDTDGEGEHFVFWQDIKEGQTWRHSTIGQRLHKKPKQLRKFQSISLGSQPHSDIAYLAIASDGTAWSLPCYGSTWQPLPNLPAA